MKSWLIVLCFVVTFVLANHSVMAKWGNSEKSRCHWYMNNQNKCQRCKRTGHSALWCKTHFVKCDWCGKNKNTCNGYIVRTRCPSCDENEQKCDMCRRDPSGPWCREHRIRCRWCDSNKPKCKVYSYKKHCPFCLEHQEECEDDPPQPTPFQIEHNSTCTWCENRYEKCEEFTVKTRCPWCHFKKGKCQKCTPGSTDPWCRSNQRSCHWCQDHNEECEQKRPKPDCPWCRSHETTCKHCRHHPGKSGCNEISFNCTYCKNHKRECEEPCDCGYQDGDDYCLQRYLLSSFRFDASKVIGFNSYNSTLHQDDRSTGFVFQNAQGPDLTHSKLVFNPHTGQRGFQTGCNDFVYSHIDMSAYQPQIRNVASLELWFKSHEESFNDTHEKILFSVSRNLDPLSDNDCALADNLLQIVQIGNVLRFRGRGTFTAGCPTPVDIPFDRVNKDTQLLITFQTSGIDIYIEGVHKHRIDFAVSTQFLISDTLNVMLGGHGNLDNAWKGEIYHLAVWCTRVTGDKVRLLLKGRGVDEYKCDCRSPCEFHDQCNVCNGNSMLPCQCQWYDSCGVCNGNNEHCHFIPKITGKFTFKSCVKCNMRDMPNSQWGPRVKFNIDVMNNQNHNVMAMFNCPKNASLSGPLTNGWDITTSKNNVNLMQKVTLDKLIRCFGQVRAKHLIKTMAPIEIILKDPQTGHIINSDICKFGIATTNKGTTRAVFNVHSGDIAIRIKDYNCTHPHMVTLNLETIVKSGGKLKYPVIMDNPAFNDLAFFNFTGDTHTECLPGTKQRTCIQRWKVKVRWPVGERIPRCFERAFTIKFKSVYGIIVKRRVRIKVCCSKKVINKKIKGLCGNICLFKDPELTKRSRKFTNCRRIFAKIKLHPLLPEHCNDYRIKIRRTRICIPDNPWSRRTVRRCSDAHTKVYTIYDAFANYYGGPEWDSQISVVPGQSCKSQVVLHFNARALGPKHLSYLVEVDFKYRHGNQHVMHTLRQPITSGEALGDTISRYVLRKNAPIVTEKRERKISSDNNVKERVEALQSYVDPYHKNRIHHQISMSCSRYEQYNNFAGMCLGRESYTLYCTLFIVACFVVIYFIWVWLIQPYFFAHPKAYPYNQNPVPIEHRHQHQHNIQYHDEPCDEPVSTRRRTIYVQ
jgi:hypothetical protein